MLHILDGAKGAYVNVLALASDQLEFEELATKAFGELGFEVLSMEDVNLLSQLKKEGREFDRELIDLELEISKDEPIQFDEFQAYVTE